MRRGSYLGGSSVVGAVGKQRKEWARRVTGRMWRHLKRQTPPVALESQTAFETRRSAPWIIIKRK